VVRRWLAGAVIVLACVVSLSGPAALGAQGVDPDIVRGRVVRPDSQPVPNAQVKVTGVTSQQSRSTRSDARGNFQILMPTGEGDYLLEVTAIGYLPVQVRLTREGDVEVLRANVVMRQAPQNLEAARIVEARRPPREAASVDVAGGDRFIGTNALSAELQGDMIQLAATIPGISLVLNPDGTIAGVSALGLAPSQNSTRLNGLPTGSANVPRDAQTRAVVSTSAYDPSRGGFSGAQVNVTSSNPAELSAYIRHGVRLTLDDPTLQSTDPAARTLRPEYRNIVMSGRSTGPVVRDTLNYNISWQANRRTSPLNSVLEADADGLNRLGLAPDSVARLTALLPTIGVPIRVGGVGSGRTTEAASMLAQIDWLKSAGAQFSTTLNASYNSNDNLGVSTRAVPAYGGRQRSFSLTAQERATTYFAGSFLNDLALGVDIQSSKGTPYLRMPQGSVLVNSAIAEGGAAPTTVAFGSGSGLRARSDAGSVSFLDQVSWFLGDNRHRIKGTVEGSYGWTSNEQLANADGSFSYLSLADLQAGRASSFTRRLNTPEISANGISGGVSIGDTFRRTNRMQFQYGFRADAATFATKPAYNAALDQALGVKTDRVPTDVGVSPRVGFNWAFGSAPAAAFPPGTFFVLAGGGGPQLPPRATLRGGVGRFWGMPTPIANTLLSAIDQTGLPSAAQQITCVGSAVPAFNWNDALANPNSVPSACADGTAGTSFAVTQPRVTAFDPSFHAPSSWRGNVELTGYITARLRGTVNLQYSENTHLGSTLDRNFAGTQRFALPDEGNRPVYVNTGSIVSTTGQSTISDSRIAPAFAQVMMNRGDGRSRSTQLSVTLTPNISFICFTNCFNGSVTYTTIAVRDAVRGFGGSTDGDPRLFSWARSNGDVRHQFQVNGFYSFLNRFNAQFTGTFRSGTPYTPMVIGDVNGDGSGGNDRAFVFAPGAAADPDVGLAMQTLMANATGEARDCLRKNLGKIAERNSCAAPWSATLSASFGIQPGTWGLPPRMQLGVNLINPLAGIDALVHGGELAGWGQTPPPDPVLLYVRGFDSNTRRFKYDVNQRFGETRANRSIPTAPFQVQVDVRWALGPSFDDQSAQMQIRRMKRPGAPPLTAAAVKTQFIQPRAQTLNQIMTLKDSIKLTAEQIVTFNETQKAYLAELDTIYTPVSNRIAAKNADPMDLESQRLMIENNRKAGYAILRAAERLSAMLTPEQKKKGQTIYFLSDNYLKQSKMQLERRISSYIY
jgi:hypothetical protein